MRILLLGLALAAGYVDAVSYLGLGRVFIANMTGNTVLLGMALAAGASENAVRSSIALGGFCAGALAGARITVSRALFAEAVILAVFASGWTLSNAASDTAARVLIGLSAFAMGMQSAAVTRLEVAGVTTTYITGTLTHLAGALARGVPKQPVLLAAVWAVYLGGAALGAWALHVERSLALAFPAALVAATAAAVAMRR